MLSARRKRCAKGARTCGALECCAEWLRLRLRLGLQRNLENLEQIWKIIDFGRAIYRFKGKRLCSDSFHKNGDAATQYNCEPFFNDNKPRLEPNKSFDLCRLGCSLYDFFIDDIHDDKIYGVAKIVSDWCKDDKGRNILYKNNGEERYPEFKLYKMIARTVHNYTPQKQIKNPLFEKFKITRKKINKKKNVLNIDIIPSYVSE